MRAATFLSLVLCAATANAQLVSLPDSEMSQIDAGAGIGFVLDNFKLDASDLKIVIHDITDSSGRNVPIKVDRLYVSGTGSNKGTTLKNVDIGRLPYPINLNLAKGEDLRTFLGGYQVQTTPTGVTVAELALPTQLPSSNSGQACIPGVGGNSTCSSRSTERFDAGLRLEFNVSPNRTDIFTVDLANAVMDGSYLRVWGDRVRDQMVGEAKVNLFAKTLDVMSCKAGGSNCSTNGLKNERTLYFTDLSVTLGLGYGKLQPLLFDVSSNGQFELELPNPVRDPAKPYQAIDTTSGEGLRRANDFYANAPRTNINVGNFNSGGARYSASSTPSGGFNFGANEISGLRFNYLKVNSRAL